MFCVTTRRPDGSYVYWYGVPSNTWKLSRFSASHVFDGPVICCPFSMYVTVCPSMFPLASYGWPTIWFVAGFTATVITVPVVDSFSVMFPNPS
jgi:hypothetical protein